MFVATENPFFLATFTLAMLYLLSKSHADNHVQINTKSYSYSSSFLFQSFFISFFFGSPLRCFHTNKYKIICFALSHLKKIKRKRKFKRSTHLNALHRISNSFFFRVRRVNNFNRRGNISPQTHAHLNNTIFSVRFTFFFTKNKVENVLHFTLRFRLFHRLDKINDFLVQLCHFVW